VKEVTTGMKNNKATGCDGIPTEASKMLITNREGTEMMTKLFNMIKAKQFPREWKTALIQPIYKRREISGRLVTMKKFDYYQF
jgi:hypothetical protein